MATIDVPFTDQQVDTDDDAGSIVMTVGMIIVGFALLAWARDVGDYVANRANSTVTGLLGIDPTSGESQEDPLF